MASENAEHNENDKRNAATLRNSKKENVRETITGIYTPMVHSSRFVRVILAWAIYILPRCGFHTQQWSEVSVRTLGGLETVT